MRDMTVGDLRALLAEYPDHHTVVLRDRENGREWVPTEVLPDTGSTAVIR